MRNIKIGFDGESFCSHVVKNKWQQLLMCIPPLQVKLYIGFFLHV